MANRRLPKQASLVIASKDDSLEALFGPPPLLKGEDPDAYAAMASRMRAAVAPTDAVEEMWTRELVDLQWEVLRWRRLKRALFDAAEPEGVMRLARSREGDRQIGEAELVWASCNRTSGRQFDRWLGEWGLTRDAVLAETLNAQLYTFKQIEDLTARAAARRDGVLREIERRRDALANRLRSASVIEDAEFVDIGAASDGA